MSGEWFNLSAEDAIEGICVSLEHERVLRERHREERASRQPERLQ